MAARLTPVQITHDVLVQTFTEDTSTAQWRVALKMEEVATDPGLAASASHVDKALSSGINEFTYNVQDPEEEWRVLRRLANQAAVDSKLLVAGGAAAAENALYSRFRVLTGVAMAETAMARKYPTVQAATAAMDTVAAIPEKMKQTVYNTQITDCNPEPLQNTLLISKR